MQAQCGDRLPNKRLRLAAWWPQLLSSWPARSEQGLLHLMLRTGWPAKLLLTTGRLCLYAACAASNGKGLHFSRFMVSSFSQTTAKHKSTQLHPRKASSKQLDIPNCRYMRRMLSQRCSAAPYGSHYPTSTMHQSY